ncbi:transcription termination factor MTERF4, chloroplastic-like [Prosopis cineraria]|uniref:transcription termination factor MTERF4, chloroplastic-like n=1 Tax=Prosopis cineraria TaxID=364024 RepID=UPI0024103D3C|nr:transcription termination factor MTERF4, chloroplastic-like [Prosopis cineraria]
MHFLKLNPTLLYSVSNLPRSFLSLFSTVVSYPTKTTAEDISIIDYLNTNVKLSKAQSVYISKRLSKARSLQHSWTVLNYFKQVGLSESQILSMIGVQPQILFSGVDKTLKPKIEYLQFLGFQGSELGELLSKNPYLLMCSLNKTLVPSVEAIRKIVNKEEDFIKLLIRYGSWVIQDHRKVLRNAAFFQSCGIVGSQLSFLLVNQGRLFVRHESLLQNYVSRAVNMGFSINSRMFVYALRSISCLSVVKLDRKLELIQSCGFSKDETMQIFRRAPPLLLQSEQRLKFGIHVCMDNIMLPKSQLVNTPAILTLSLEKRVTPRWRVLQLLISKELLKKNPSFLECYYCRRGNSCRTIFSNLEIMKRLYWRLTRVRSKRCFYLIIIIKFCLVGFYSQP